MPYATFNVFMNKFENFQMAILCSSMKGSTAVVTCWIFVITVHKLKHKFENIQITTTSSRVKWGFPVLVPRSWFFYVITNVLTHF